MKLKCNRNVLIYPRFWGTFCRVTLPWTFSRHAYPLSWSIVCSASGLAVLRRQSALYYASMRASRLAGHRAGSGHLVDREWPHTARGEGVHSAGDSTARTELRVRHSVSRVSCPGQSDYSGSPNPLRESRKPAEHQLLGIRRRRGRLLVTRLLRLVACPVPVLARVLWVTDAGVTEYVIPARALFTLLHLSPGPCLRGA